jgi:hypothetical protein
VKNFKLRARIYHFAMHIYVFYAETAGRENAGGGLIAEHEDIRVMELPVAQAYKMLEQGKIADAKTIVGLLLAKERVGE